MANSDDWWQTYWNSMGYLPDPSGDRFNAAMQAYTEAQKAEKDEEQDQLLEDALDKIDAQTAGSVDIAKEQGVQNRQTQGAGYQQDLGRSYYDALNDSNQQQWQANVAADMAGFQSGLDAATNVSLEQIERARSEYNPNIHFYDEAMQTGGISDAEEQTYLQAILGDYAQTAAATQGAYNSGLAARGLGSNVGAAMAAGNKARFAANDAMGTARGQLVMDRADRKMQAAEARRGIADSLAGLDTTQTFETTIGQLGQIEQPDYAAGPTVATPDYSIPGGGFGINYTGAETGSPQAPQAPSTNGNDDDDDDDDDRIPLYAR